MPRPKPNSVHHSEECDRTWKAVDELTKVLNRGEATDAEKLMVVEALEAFVRSQCTVCDDPDAIFTAMERWVPHDR